MLSVLCGKRSFNSCHLWNHVCVCLCACICVCACVCVCARAHACACACVRARIFLNIYYLLVYVYIISFISTGKCVYILKYLLFVDVRSYYIGYIYRCVCIFWNIYYLLMYVYIISFISISKRVCASVRTCGCSGVRAWSIKLFRSWSTICRSIGRNGIQHESPRYLRGSGWSVCVEQSSRCLDERAVARRYRDQWAPETYSRPDSEQNWILWDDGERLDSIWAKGTRYNCVAAQSSTCFDLSSSTSIEPDQKGCP